VSRFLNPSRVPEGHALDQRRHGPRRGLGRLRHLVATAWYSPRRGYCTASCTYAEAIDSLRDSLGMPENPDPSPTLLRPTRRDGIPKSKLAELLDRTDLMNEAGAVLAEHSDGLAFVPRARAGRSRRRSRTRRRLHLEEGVQPLGLPVAGNRPWRSSITTRKKSSSEGSTRISPRRAAAPCIARVQQRVPYTCTPPLRTEFQTVLRQLRSSRL
jgi:hypothetical protein